MAVDTEANPKTPETTVGRTPWDAGTILLLVLGRAVPYVTVLAIAVYAVIEVSKADDRARTDAIQEYATRVEKLIALQESGFTQYEALRTGQIETLEKLTNLTGKMITSAEENQQAIINSQQKISEQRTRLTEAQEDARQAQIEKEDAERDVVAQENKAAELEAQLIGAEARLDLAFRITEYVAAGGPGHTPELKRTALSEIFEGSKPDALRTDPSGERFYGIFRITGDEMGNFINFCLTQFPFIGATLQEAGGQAGAKEGRQAFREAWIGLVGVPMFRAAQDTYIREKYYEPLIDELESTFTKQFPDGDPRTLVALQTVQAVVWSVAVQHGRRKDLIKRVLAQFTDLPDATAFINAVYNERQQVERYFPKEPLDMQRVLEARYVFERQAALDMLAAEQKQIGGGSNQ